MSDSPISCYCYSCCFLVFVLLLDCCCFPPKLSFVVRTRAAMCWFFWILFGYYPSANEGPSKVPKSWCQLRLCWKQQSKVVHSTYIAIYVHTAIGIWVNPCVGNALRLQRYTCTFVHTQNVCPGAVPHKRMWGAACYKRAFYIRLQKIFLDQKMKRLSRFCRVLICQSGSH